MRAIVTIIDEKTGHVFMKDRLVEPYREQRDPQLCATRYDFRFELNVSDSYFRDILDSSPVVDQPPFPYDFTGKEEKHCGDCKYTDHKKSEPPCNSCDSTFENYVDKNKKVKIDFDINDLTKGVKKWR